MANKTRLVSKRPAPSAGARRLGAGVLAALLCAPALAKDALLLGGVEGSPETSYAYVATVLPLPGSKLGSGWVQKYWLDRLTYSYRSGDREIDARAYGAEAALGYQNSWAGGWGAAYLGVRYSDTRLTPDNPDSRVRGGQFGAKVQLEGEQDFTEWRANGIASYVFASRGYWARARLQYRLPNGLYLGPELIVQGDPDYRGRSAGLALTGLRVGAKTYLGFHGGVRKIEGTNREGYVGLELGSVY